MHGDNRYFLTPSGFDLIVFFTNELELTFEFEKYYTIYFFIAFHQWKRQFFLGRHRLQELLWSSSPPSPGGSLLSILTSMYLYNAYVILTLLHTFDALVHAISLQKEKARKKIILLTVRSNLEGTEIVCR